GVGVGPEPVPAFLELRAQAPPAVDLAVERDPGLAVRSDHRLPGGLAEIDDRQALEADLGRPVELEATRIGPSMRNRVERFRIAPGRIGSSDEAAHVQILRNAGRRRRCDTL